MSVSAQKPPKNPRRRRDGTNFLASRNGSLVIAVVAAVLGGALLLVFLSSYKKSVDKNDKTAPVLVAQRVIEKGSSGDVIATQGLYQASRLKKADLKPGALSDPSALRGKVAARDILPGQQLTSHEFAASTGSLADSLGSDQRAIAISLDSQHGLLGKVRAGDRVDVIGVFNWQPQNTGATIPVARTLLQNALVMRAPGSAGSSNSTGTGSDKTVVLQAPSSMASQLAFTADEGKVWIVERSKAGSKPTDSGLVTLDTVLFGTKPIPTGGSSALNKAAKRARQLAARGG